MVNTRNFTLKGFLIKQEGIPKIIFNSSWAGILVSVIIGLCTGAFAILFNLLIDFLTETYSTIGFSLFGFLPYGMWIIFIPALGGLLVGLLVYYLANEAKGTGIPDVMEAVALKNGFIRKRVVWVKMLAAASSISSGASVGKEGPIVQIGSSLGSLIGQLLNINTARLRICVACGAAAGIAATFNAPIAGVIFAQEVILGEFVSTAFVYIVISAVSSLVVVQTFLGDLSIFSVQQYSFNSPVELIFYVMLGVLSALTGVAFVKTLYKTEDLFNKHRVFPEWLKPAIGGLMVGIIGFKAPAVLGIGYDTIEEIFRQGVFLQTLIILIGLKIIVTAITLGSGHSGGVFAPSLFIGAALGEAFGLGLTELFPSLQISPGAYAIVGMGAVVAGTTQAPISSALIIFEMTRDYRIILPLLLAVVFSLLIHSYFSKGESVFTLKLVRKGVNLKSGKDVNIMKRITVNDVMSSPVEICLDENNVGAVIQMMHDSKHNGFPVLNNKQELVGIITLKDIREAPVEGIMELKVTKLMSRKLIIAYSEDTLDDVFRKLSRYDLGHLPVVSKDNSKKLLGIVTRSDIIKAYDKQLLVHEEQEIFSNQKSS